MICGVFVNVVPMIKKNEKLRICMDFENLNSTAPKDKYLMPVIDVLFNRVARHRYLSFVDGYLGYN